jgi:ABC-type glycerol-3-phosphate transport system permease component
MSLTGRQAIRYWLVTVVAWIVVLILCVPLMWMIASSLKGPTEIISGAPTFLPKVVDWTNYAELVSSDFPVWFRNSVFVSLATVAVVIVIGTLAAYSLTRFRYPGRRIAAIAVLFTYLFPSVLMLVPLFLIISELKINNTPLALILANTTFALPLTIWLLRSYFLSVPAQVEEAAMVDGASRLRGFAEVVLPQVAPGIISTAIFAFIVSWDDYLFASIFISSPQLRTLPVGIATYASDLSPEWGLLMASSVMTTLPVLIVFALLQRQLLPDVSAGAVKA